MISACANPAPRCAPWPTIVPVRSTTTAPTIGFGVVRPSPRVASCRARRMNAASRSVTLDEEGIDVRVRVERHEIIQLLADADVADRQAQVVRDRNRDAALR